MSVSRNKSIGAAGAVVLLVAVGACKPAVRETGSEDPRTAIVLPPAARNAVLAEMRQMLTALNGVLVAGSRADAPAMREAALSGGTAMAVDLDPAVGDRLPRAFKQLGLSTHGGFDEVAAAIEVGAGLDEVVDRLGQLTGNCVACHAQYRIEEERDAP